MLDIRFLGYQPSRMAAAALLCALKTTGFDWTNSLVELTRLTKEEIRRPYRALYEMVLKWNQKTHHAVITKYSNRKYSSVALLRPLPQKSLKYGAVSRLRPGHCRI